MGPPTTWVHIFQNTLVVLIDAHGLVFLSAFLYSIGLYYSAISISEDSSLRKTIRRSALELFDEIGTAQMEQDVQKRILKIVKSNKEKLESDTGISSTVTEDDVNQKSNYNFLIQFSLEIKHKRR